MDKNFKYIEKNFIEIENLSKLTNLSIAEIEDFVEKKLIPSYSYSVSIDLKITSPLNDSYSNQVQKKYFGKNVLSLLNHLKNNPTDPAKIKNRFKQNFIKRLKEHKYKEFAYDDILKNNNEKLEEAFEEEWDFYCKGGYGICTLNVTENDIIDKEIAVKRLMAFNEKYATKKITEEQKKELTILNDEFNKIASLFAPYQRKSSSRGKYLDKILTDNKMEELIKNYD